MKSLKNKTITEIIDGSTKGRTANFRYGGTSEEDSRKLALAFQEQSEVAAFLQILRSLMDDVLRLRPGTKGLARDYVTLVARIEHEGIAFLGTALCSLGNALDKGLADGYFTCPTGFKRRKGEQIPLLFGGIFRDVFDSVTGNLKENSSAEDVKILRQLLFFLEEASMRASKRIASHREHAEKLRSDRSSGKEHSSLSARSYQPYLPFSFTDTR